MEDRERVRLVEELARRVRRGDYSVDAGAVAQAMLRRRGVRKLLLAPPAPHSADGDSDRRD
jgi:anti-sigma-28 factor FlgM